MRLRLRNKTIFVAVLALATWATQLPAWQWQLPLERYRALNMFERAQYDKARKRLEDSQFRSAAAEFEKFKIQFEDSELLPYVVLMRGYCLHQAKDRHRAIKVYNEVMDYFPDSIDDASAALYHLGVAHFENGDVKAALEAMKEMAEDEDYNKHPLAAGALVRLADNHLRNKEPEQAVKYWRQVIRDFGKTNREQSSAAERSLVTYCLQNRNYSSLDNWPSTEDNQQDAKQRQRRVDRAFEIAFQGFRDYNPREQWDDYSRSTKTRQKADKQAFWVYLRSRKSLYDANGKQADYYVNYL